MRTANVHEAKTNLSKLLDAAERGEEVVITRRGSGVTQFRLTPVTREQHRLFGALADEVRFADDYEMVDGEIAEAFAERLEH